MSSLKNILQIEQLPSHIVQFLALLEDFHNVLLSETQALKSNNSDQLSKLLPSKSQLSEDIAQRTKTLESLLNTQQLTLTNLFDSTLSENIPKPLQHNIEQIITLSNQCHDLNQSNGISIQILSNLNQHTLNLVSGKEPSNVKLYSAKGETKSSGQTAQKPLGKA